MGRIVAVEYLTLDGVFEDPAWTQPYFDEAVAAFQGEAMRWADALLLGPGHLRRHEPGLARDGQRPVDRRRHHELDRQVRPDLDAHASRPGTRRSWTATSSTRSPRLKAGSENLVVYGSGQLTETLRAAGLIDEYRLLICPIVLGEGRKLFTGGTPSEFTVTRQQHRAVGHGAAHPGHGLTGRRGRPRRRRAERHVRGARRPDPPGHPRPAGRGRRDGQRARRALPGHLPAGGQQAPQGARAGRPGDARPQRAAAARSPARRAARRGHRLARALPQLLRGLARPAGRAPRPAPAAARRRPRPGRNLTMVELEFVRTYAAPRQLVWDAWTDPDQMAQWWGPRGVSTPRESIELDLRPGGRMRFDMVDDATGSALPEQRHGARGRSAGADRVGRRRLPRRHRQGNGDGHVHCGRRRDDDAARARRRRLHRARSGRRRGGLGQPAGQARGAPRATSEKWESPVSGAFL